MTHDLWILTHLDIPLILAWKCHKITKLKQVIIIIPFRKCHLLILNDCFYTIFNIVLHYFCDILTGNTLNKLWSSFQLIRFLLFYKPLFHQCSPTIFSYIHCTWLLVAGVSISFNHNFFLIITRYVNHTNMFSIRSSVHKCMSVDQLHCYLLGPYTNIIISINLPLCELSPKLGYIQSY